jgi:hypothetical protein
MECRDVVDAGKWEDVLHAAFRARGVTLWSRPDIVVDHKKHYTIGEYTSQRFLYARAYASSRIHGSGAARAVTYGALALALPALLYFRIVSRIWKTGAHRAELMRSLPLLLLFVSAWGAGEATGAFLGDGGALAKVK